MGGKVSLVELDGRALYYLLLLLLKLIINVRASPLIKYSKLSLYKIYNRWKFMLPIKTTKL